MSQMTASFLKASWFKNEIYIYISRITPKYEHMKGSFQIT